MVKCFAKLDILGYIDEYRAGATAASQLEGLVYDIRQVFDARYQEVVLCNRLGHSKNIGLLKRIAPDKGTGHLSGDGHNWCESM